jgi:hypothetical protein
MFTSVIGTLTSLLPRTFIFGSYVPVLIFSFVNLVAVYLFSAWSRSGIEFWLAKSPALAIGVAFVGTVAIAYVASAINDFMREFLEGRHVGLAFVARALCDEQKERRIDLGNRYATARRRRFRLSDVIERCERKVREASAQSGKPGHLGRAWPGDELLEQLRAIVREGAFSKIRAQEVDDDKQRRKETQRTDSSTIGADPAFDEMLHTIRFVARRMAREIAVRRKPLPAKIESDRRDLLLLMGAIRDSANQAEFEAGAELFTRFGNDPPKPTRMGNVAAAIQAYTIGRYKMEMTVFFSRLQTVLVKNDDKAYGLVLDAKAQLDFLVACCWFSGVTTLVWSFLLASFGNEYGPFLGVAVVGTAATVALYFLACQNYLSYGEVVRACIDVNRFALLNQLAIRQPSSLREERMLWSTMSHLAFSGSDSFELSYEHRESP